MDKKIAQGIEQLARELAQALENLELTQKQSDDYKRWWLEERNEREKVQKELEALRMKGQEQD